MKRLALAGVVLASLVFTGGAGAYQFSISDPYHRFTPQTIQRIERAVSFQVNMQVAKYWTVDPASFLDSTNITTATTQWDCQNAITIDLQPTMPSFCAADAGCHAVSTLYVLTTQTTPMVENTISHEVVETETDRPGTGWQTPGDGGYEVCDPAGYNYRGLGGVWLADFVLPAYYQGNHKADFKGWL